VLATLDAVRVDVTRPESPLGQSVLPLQTALIAEFTMTLAPQLGIGASA
jgi:hypothetical protein